MSTQAAVGFSAAVRHPVRNVAGTLVTGQSGALTRTLSDPTGATSAVLTLVSEIGASGWYLVSFVPTSAGIWILRVTNPAIPTGDGQAVEYSIDAHAQGVVAAVPALYGLTTVERVKTYLGIPAGNVAHDAVLGYLVDDVSWELQRRIGRHLGGALYSETYRGDGTPRLWLRQAPVTSLDAIYSRSYSVSYPTGVSDTLLDSRLYRLVQFSQAELADPQLADRPAMIERVDGGLWDLGQAYRVEYAAGYAVLPGAIVGEATRLVVARFRTRDTGDALESIGAIDAATQPISPAEMDALAERIAARWRFDSGIS